jgi:hypothetical protein
LCGRSWPTYSRVGPLAQDPLELAGHALVGRHPGRPGDVDDEGRDPHVGEAHVHELGCVVAGDGERKVDLVPQEPQLRTPGLEEPGEARVEVLVVGGRRDVVVHHDEAVAVGEEERQHLRLADRRVEHEQVLLPAALRRGRVVAQAPHVLGQSGVHVEGVDLRRPDAAQERPQPHGRVGDRVGR